MEEEQKGAPTNGLDWLLERQYAYEREMLMAATAAAGGGGGGGVFPHKKQRPLAADLLQNCDLPPPAKLYGPVVVAPVGGGANPQRSQEGEEKGHDNSNNLLRALRLSQSRAREAEEKLAAAGAGKEEMAALLLKHSMVLSAHRRWVLMLEAENSLLRSHGAGEEATEGDGTGSARAGVAAWWVAFALCLGIAGVGLAFGRFLL